jgi:hypothetical protein
MPRRCGNLNALAGLTSRRSSRKPARLSLPCRVVPVLLPGTATPAKQVHVHEQRAAADDLQQLPPARELFPASSTRAQPARPGTATAHEADHGGARDEPTGGHRRGLGDRDHRARRRLRNEHLGLREYHERVHFLGVSLDRVWLYRLAHPVESRDGSGGDGPVPST